jgi:hypothetical protein
MTFGVVEGLLFSGAETIRNARNLQVLIGLCSKIRTIRQQNPSFTKVGY